MANIPIYLERGSTSVFAVAVALDWPGWCRRAKSENEAIETLDADTKLVPTWLVGEHTLSDAYVFLSDLKSRLKDSRIQLTTDGLRNYLRS